jgi:hypothetical protein
MTSESPTSANVLGNAADTYPEHMSDYHLILRMQCLQSTTCEEAVATNEQSTALRPLKMDRPIFLILACELRNKTYEQLLVLQKPIDSRVGYNQRQKLALGLVRAKRTVHLEASSVLPAQNCFHFTMYAVSADVPPLLEQIGRNKATYIRHVYANFPTFHSLDRHDIILEGDSIRILAKIQSDCIKLSTLTKSMWSTNAMECA